MSKIRFTLATLLALFGILTFLERFVLVELLVRRTAVPMLLALAEGLAIIATGAMLRRSKRLDAPVDFLIGYPVFGALCFLVALMGVSAWTMVPLLIVGGMGGIALLLMLYANDERAARVAPASHDAPLVPEGPPDMQPGDGRYMQSTAFLAVMTVLACGFVVAQAPPASLDEVAYHLAVPQTWVLEGRAIELPLLSHSYFPLGIESADLPLLTLLGATGGGIASHFLHLFAAIATTVLLVRQTKSWLATAAIVTTPALAVIAGWSLVEWPLVGLFVILWISTSTGTSTVHDDHRTASAATAAGLLTKYTFLPFALLVWAFKRRVPSWIALAGLIFFARNAILTGNPVAPFLGADAPHVSGFRELALSDYIFDGDVIDESIGASLLSLAPFATGAIPLATLTGAVLLFLLAPTSRVLVPFLVIPALSAAPALRKRIVPALVTFAVVVQTFLVVWFTARSNSFSLLAATAGEEEYLAGQRAAQSSVIWLNEVLPPESRTLVVGLNETYWFARPVRGGGNFDGPRVSQYLDTPAPEILRDRLRRDGITHVAIVTAAAPLKAGQRPDERHTALSPEAQQTLATTLDRYAANVVARGTATLFTLR